MLREERNPFEGGLEAGSHFMSIENTILYLIQSDSYSTNQGIDLPQLQNDCLGLGFTQREFSCGFVKLLSKRLLEPCGDFVYRLSAEGRELPLVATQTLKQSPTT